MNNLHWSEESRYTIGHELVLSAPSHTLTLEVLEALRKL